MEVCQDCSACEPGWSPEFGMGGEALQALETQRDAIRKRHGGSCDRWCSLGDAADPVDGRSTGRRLPLHRQPRASSPGTGLPTRPRVSEVAARAGPISDNRSFSALRSSISQSRAAGRPGLAAANAATAASFAYRRSVMIVDTSTRYLRAASAWVISFEVTSKNACHYTSGINLRRGRGSLDANCPSSGQTRK